MRQLASIFAILGLGLGIMPLAAANPFMPSARDQIKLGQRVAADVRKQNRILPDSDPMVRTMRRIANRILTEAPEERPQGPWEFTFDVIDKPEVNAFALPGGPIFFYRGLIERFETEDQFAAVIAHEMAHIQRQHWARAYRDSQQRNLVLTLGLLLLNANRTAVDIASITNDVVLTLPYSRRQETEADEVGMDTMVRAGFNPYGMIDVFGILERSNRGGRPLEYLSTHPDTRRRASHIENRIRRLDREWPAQTPLRFTTSTSG